jgi:hypothetical protein
MSTERRSASVGIASTTVAMFGTSSGVTFVTEPGAAGIRDFR